MRDLRSNIDIVQSIVPAVYSADADGDGVDLQGYDSALAEITTGADVAGTHAPEIQESDSLASGYTTVAAADLQGAFSANIGADTIERVGYIGKKRFIKVFVTTSGASLAYAANIIRSKSSQLPLA